MIIINLCSSLSGHITQQNVYKICQEIEKMFCIYVQFLNETESSD